MPNRVAELVGARRVASMWGLSATTGSLDTEVFEDYRQPRQSMAGNYRYRAKICARDVAYADRPISGTPV
jgi:hypothetical protein